MLSDQPSLRLIRCMFTLQLLDANDSCDEFDVVGWGGKEVLVLPLWGFGDEADGSGGWWWERREWELAVRREVGEEGGRGVSKTQPHASQSSPTS